METDSGERRTQVLHRDLKPDNGTFSTDLLSGHLRIDWWTVFLDENNSVKLGDFGLSKALAQASFANTYVGVRSAALYSTPRFSLHITPRRRRTICLQNLCRRKHTIPNPIFGRSDALFMNYVH